MSDLRQMLTPAGLARLARFFGVGIAGTLVYVLLGFLLLRAGLGVLSAHLLASLISLAFSYAGQKILTFGIRGENRRMGPRFALATVALLIFQFLLVWIASRLGASDGVALIVNTLVYPPTSFLVHSFWTFRTRAPVEA